MVGVGRSASASAVGSHDRRTQLGEREPPPSSPPPPPRTEGGAGGAEAPANPGGVVALGEPRVAAVEHQRERLEAARPLALERDEKEQRCRGGAGCSRRCWAIAGSRARRVHLG